MHFSVMMVFFYDDAGAIGNTDLMPADQVMLKHK
jgi:hypothetical protein